jgi:hypothetical protein
MLLSHLLKYSCLRSSIQESIVFVGNRGVGLHKHFTLFRRNFPFAGSRAGLPRLQHLLLSYAL